MYRYRNHAIAGFFVCMAVGLCQAGVVAERKGKDKSKILLFSEAGEWCTKGALRSQHISNLGRTTEGCWKAVPMMGVLSIVFSDADALMLQMAEFKKPEEI